MAQELEAAQMRDTGALATARSSAASAAQQHEAAARQADERLSAAQAEIQSLKQQVHLLLLHLSAPGECEGGDMCMVCQSRPFYNTTA